MSQRRSRSTKNPVEKLYYCLKKPVVVRVKRNRLFKGTLMSYDPHLNILLEDCTYTYNERQDDGSYEPVNEKFDKLILRGDNIVFIALDKS